MNTPQSVRIVEVGPRDGLQMKSKLSAPKSRFNSSVSLPTRD
jgi:hypothetical protein